MKLRLAAALASIAVLSGSLLGRSADTGTTEHYKLDPVHSSAVFKIKHIGASFFYGRFNSMNGEFTYNAEDPSAISFDVFVRTDSVDTNNEMRTKHLKSADFFNAAEFPTIRFKSTKVARGAGNVYDVTGDLSLHGVIKPITAQVEFIGKGEMQGRKRAGYDASLTIKRTDFGMETYVKEGALGDDVKLMIGLEGTREDG